MEIAALGLRVDGVRDIDQASASLDRFTKSGSEAEKRVGGVGKTSRESSRSVRDLGKTSGSTSANFAALARSAAGVAASLGLIASVSSVFRRMVATTSSFEDSMAKVRAITRATDADMVRLSKTARELGASTVFSAAEAADGLQFLGMAGFNTQQAISAIPGVLDLAASSAMGLAQTADIATNVMSGFSLAAAESGRVADILAAASSRANTDVAQLGDAMSTVAPIAAAMNISIEDTAAAIGVLSDAGIQGSRAGTSLRGVFAALAGPTTQAQKILARVGLTVQDINPEFSDLETVLGRLSTAGLSTADMMQIFGREAASGAIVLAEAAGRVGELGDELRGAEGEARRMAETMQDTLTGDTKELSSAIEELLLNLNDKTGLQAMLRGSTQRSTELVSGFNTLLNESELLNETLRLISSTAGALIDAVKLMVGGIVDAVREFGEMIGVIKLAESALPGLTRAVRFFADGIQDASIWLRFFGNVVKRAFTGDVKAIQNSWAELQEAFKDRVAERETRRLNDAVEDLLKNTELFGTFEGAVTDAVGQLAEDAIDAAGGVGELDDELQKLIKSLQSVVDKYDLSGARARQLKKDHAGLQQAMAMGLPGAKEAMDAYNESIKAVEQSTETLAVTTEESADWMATSFDRGVERMRDGIGNFFERMIVDGKASFSDLTDLFKKMIAEMIATAAANRIMIGLGFMGAAGGASAGGLGGGSGAGGLGNLFNVAQMANTFKQVWSGIQGLATGQGLAGFSGLGGGLTASIGHWASNAGNMISSGLNNLGLSAMNSAINEAGYRIAEAVGQGVSVGQATLIGSAATAGAGWAGGYAGAGLGRDLFGKEGSGWGATGGAIIGSYWGPWGSALGGLIGGVVDSIFGSSAWNTTRGGLQLGFGEDGFDPMQWTRQTKKGGLFSSTKRRYRFHELDEELDAALNETYSAALDGVREMYGVLGVAVEDGVLEGVQIATLQIGTSGKSKQTQKQIDAQITQWFADLQEAAVQAIDPSLTAESLTIYASSLASVNEVFGAVGLSAYDVSIEGGKAAAQLLALSGGIENLLTATDYYYQNFYSEQERLANLTEQTTSAFEALGKTLPGSRDEFRQLVESIDQTTESGRVMFLQLLNLAPAMHDIASAAEEAAAAASEMESAVRQERLGLEREYLTLVGNTNSLRKRELAALDESNRAWQERIWAIEEQNEALGQLNRIAQQAASATLGISSSTGSLSEKILLDQMSSDEEMYRYFKQQADALSSSIVGMTDIDAIGKAVADATRLADRAWGLLDAEQRAAKAPEYQDYLQRLESSGHEQVKEAARVQAEATAKATSEAVAASLKPAVDAIVSVLERSGDDSKEVAEAIIAAITSVGSTAYREVEVNG